MVCGKFAAEIIRVAVLAALWRTGAAGGIFGGNEGATQPQGRPVIVMRGMPVMMLGGHFGHDPFEDMHRNIENLLKQSGEDEAPAAANGVVPFKTIQSQMGNIMQAFGGSHAGHSGRSEGSFQVDDKDKTLFKITATLPGYKFSKSGMQSLDQASESPLSVQAVGRSLVVKGMQQSGNVIRSWQRSFALPKGCELDHIAVTYNAKTGNLSVDVPRHEATAEEEQEDNEDDDDGINEMLPPILRAMNGLLPGMDSGPIRIRVSTGLRGSRGGGLDMGDILGKLLADVGEMHPRLHLPEGGEKPPPEDADINFVGCFAEPQLDKVDLKYYGKKNAASFNAMYWHSQADHVSYFAMARHSAPLGHAFTSHGFVHDNEEPKWGRYDGCGSRCEDDDSRWCGCANEASRQEGNGDCAEGEKKFAVYKVGLTPEQLEETKPEAVIDAPKGDAEAAGAAIPSGDDKVAKVKDDNRAHWQLDEQDPDAPSIRIIVPKGTIVKPSGNGRQVHIYKEGEEVAGSPMGKMKLPVEVNESSCVDEGEKDGSRITKCNIEKDKVRQVPIRVIDEL